MTQATSGQDGRIFLDDARGRLYRVINGTTSTTYKVNAAGQRVIKTAGDGVVTVYHYDKDGNLIAESTANGQGDTRVHLPGWRCRSLWSMRPLPSALNFIHPDHLGTPRVIVNASNTPVWRWDSADPFGSLRRHSNSAGYLHLQPALPGTVLRPGDESALQLLPRLRSDNWQVHSIGSDRAEGWGQHIYVYVRGNPVSKVDPNGLIDSMTP